ncbi:hypothetical protein [Microbacterium sp. NIBRBAC000506063]|uniref:hypothetical protein n=1 Tax=Microbacterium sp. NIBRBAC000506063 TaxID=2734618 RepID=UPI002948BA4D|nr:hypothetical protein [Microbacterium sp. NIBRBAC000506063]
MTGQRLRVALGELHHEIGRLAVDPEDVAGEVELGLCLGDLLGAVGREELDRIPTATQPIGTTVASGSAARRCTIAFTRISLRAPTRAPLKTRAPDARKHSSPMSAPATEDSVPSSELRPMCTALAAVARTRAFSMTITCSPSTIGPPSAVITAPCSTWQPGPISTSPEMTAVGATTAVSWMRGRAPRCSNCMPPG